MSYNIRLCDDHVENLKKNNPCSSCPARSKPDKYEPSPMITGNVSKLFAGSLMLVLGSLAIVGYDYLETKKNAREGLKMAETNRLLLKGHKETVGEVTAGLNKLSITLTELRIVLAENYIKRTIARDSD